MKFTLFKCILLTISSAKLHGSYAKVHDGNSVGVSEGEGLGIVMVTAVSKSIFYHTNMYF